MTTTIALGAEQRTDTGKGPARQMRLNGRIPAVIYGRGRNPESLSISLSELERVLTGRSAGSTVIDLTIGSNTVQALIREMQRHPVKRTVTHVDFYEIHEGEEINMAVPIHLEGMPSGVRNAGGTLDQVLREIQIAVLPRHIPERVVLDVSGLEIGQSLHVSDLQVENVKILTDTSATICSVIAPRVEEETTTETEEEAEEGAEPELIRKPKAEGEDEGGESEG